MIAVGEECDCGLGEWPHPPHADGLRVLPPTYSRLEYWNAQTNSWVLAHAGIALLYPRRYVTRLALRGKVGRVTLENGVVIQEDVSTCFWCETTHPGPHDGLCLL